MTTESRLPEIVAECDALDDLYRDDRLTLVDAAAALRWIREVIAGPRIAVTEHELPQD